MIIKILINVFFFSILIVSNICLLMNLSQLTKYLIPPIKLLPFFNKSLKLYKNNFNLLIEPIYNNILYNNITGCHNNYLNDYNINENNYKYVIKIE